MRQTYNVAVAGSVAGACLPDGSPIAAVAIDNPSGYWYQVSPFSVWIPPFTGGIVIDGTGVPGVDLKPSPVGPAKQLSVSTGDGPVLTVFDATEAPSLDPGSTLAWATPGTAGTLRYLGKLTVISTGIPPIVASVGQYAIQPSERSIVLIANANGTALPLVAQAATTSLGPSSVFSPQVVLMGLFAGLPNIVPATLPVSANIDSVWSVSISTYGTQPAGSTDVFVFASTDAAPTMNPQQPMPIAVTDGVNLLGGQQPANVSLPVVQAGNVFLPGPAFRKPYDSLLFSQPAVNGLATVTFTATAGRRWVIDFASWSLMNNAAATTTQNAIINDGATQVYGDGIAIPAVTGSSSRVSVGPGAGIVGSVGNAMTVAFTGAGAGGIYERVNAGAYLLPAGM